MEPAADGRPDWRSSAPYRALLGIDRAGLAWEWLRRDPGYIACARNARSAFFACEPARTLTADAAAEQWGLHFRRICGSSGAARALAVARRG